LFVELQVKEDILVDFIREGVCMEERPVELIHILIVLLLLDGLLFFVIVGVLTYCDMALDAELSTV
jgi:hypothetical protein